MLFLYAKQTNTFKCSAMTTNNNNKTLIQGNISSRCLCLML